MEWLSLLMRWLHLVSVAVLIGSAAFMVVVLRPALADRARESRRDFFLSLKIRLKMLVHGSIAGILVSGLYNTHLGWKTALAPNLEVFLTKVSLALAVLALVIVAFAGRSPDSDPLSPRSRWLTWGLILGLAVVVLSVYLGSLHP